MDMAEDVEPRPHAPHRLGEGRIAQMLALEVLVLCAERRAVGEQQVEAVGELGPVVGERRRAAGEGPAAEAVGPGRAVEPEAVRLNSAAIIVAHSHPSGDPTPSPEDILVTRQIVEAGKLLDVDTLDHVVIGRGRWVSMRERGLGF
jgi:hypothetical protein